MYVCMYILCSTRVPRLAEETSARAYPPPSLYIYIYIYFSLSYQFWVMGFVVLVIWVTGYVGFSWYVPLVLKSNSFLFLFFFFLDICVM